MATSLEFECKKLADKPLQLVGDFNYSIESAADVTNMANDNRITFSPCTPSNFTFTVKNPDNDVIDKLITWISQHEIKDEGIFRIFFDADKSSKPREIKLKRVCLVSYNETINDKDFLIALTVVGQEVTMAGVVLKLTELL